MADQDEVRARRWSAAAAVATAIVSGAAFIVLALIVRAAPLPVDVAVAAWLRPLSLGPAGTVIDALNLLGQPLPWDSLVAVIAIVLWRRGLRLWAVVLLAGVIGAETGASIAKVLVGRPRPPGVVVVDLITQASYPSGHVTRAVVTSGLLVAMARPRRAWRAASVLAAAAFVALMGIARIAVGEHWFTDVVGAVLFGVLSLAIIGIITRSWWMRAPEWEAT